MSYASRMVNAQDRYPNGQRRHDSSREHKEGFRDALHACADIAEEADAEIATLRAELQAVKGVTRGLVETIDAAIRLGDWEVDGRCDPDMDLERARALMEKSDG